MKYNIKTTDFLLTDAISDYINKKIERLDRFVSPEDKDVLMCYIEIGKTTNHHKNGDLFKAEFTIHIGSNVLRVENTEEDLYSSIDEVIEGMSEKLNSFKKKKVSLIRRGGAKMKAIMRKFGM
jgi:putative sigma-54 modulation protein